MSDQKYEVPQLWALAGLEGNPATQQQIDGWWKTFDLIDQHAKTITDASTELETTWPATSNEAARAFSRFVNLFLASMEDTKNACANTATGLDNINSAINEFIPELRKINLQWQKYQQTEHQKNTDGVIDSVVDFFDGDADLPADWRQQLNQQASGLLSRLDGHVAEAMAYIEAPLPYKPKVAEYKDSDGDGGGAGAAIGGTLLGSGIGAGFLSTIGSAQIPPLAPPPTMPTDVGGRGPDLAGTGPGASTLTPPGGTAPPVGGAGNFAPAPGTPPPPTANSIIPRASIPLPRSGGVIGSPPSGSAARSGAVGIPARRVMPAGGVIGGSPQMGNPAKGAASARFGRPGTTSPNPVARSGRVLGAQPHSGPGSPTGSPGRATRPAESVGPVGSRRSRRDDDNQRFAFDPDDPWRVERGGPGLIAPREEYPPERHDPGSNVLGMDR